MTDLRRALRTLARSPGFTFAAVATLALGIGGCTLLFSAVHASLVRPLPYPESDRLVVLWGARDIGSVERSQVSVTEIEDYRAGTEVFADVATFTEYRPLLSVDDSSERLVGGLVSDAFFRVLGVEAERGRLFVPEEQLEDRDDVVVLTHGLWVRRFGADPSIVGSTIRVNLRDHQVVGILPADFAALPSSLMDHPPDLYRPLAESYDNDSRGSRHVRAIARLLPGVGRAEAQSAVEVVAARLAAEYPEDSAGVCLRVAALQADAVAGYRQALLVLMTAVALVLLVACANVAHLILARMAPRQGELAVRTALGASRGRLARLLVLESGLLALAGAAGGLALARLGLVLLRGLGERFPLLDRTSLDPAVFLFAVGVTALAATLMGLLPAWQAARTDPAAALAGGARIAGRGARRALVVTEVAAAAVLLVGSGLTLRSLWRLQSVDPGFDVGDKLTAGVWLPYSAYAEPASRIAFFDALLERVDALPGVRSAAVTSVLPLGENFDRASIEVEDREFPDGDEPQPDRYAVSPGYLEVMGIQVLRGRGIEPTDRESTPPVALVSRSLAEQIWPGEDPIGRRIQLPADPGEENPWREVVGLVEDVRQYGLDVAPTPAMYFPYTQFPMTYVSLIVAGEGGRVDAGQVAEAAREVDPDQALFDLATGDVLLRRATERHRLPSLVLTVLAGIVLGMAAIGLFGVVALGVAERRREIGVRFALGATAGDVGRAVLGDVSALVALGLAVGLGLAWPAALLLRGLLFGIETHDPVSFAFAPAGLALAALLAAWIPVRRAARIDPMDALRSE
ncbi:MAG: ABC transporter permease [Thermoanaerobaculia bacterium]